MSLKLLLLFVGALSQFEGWEEKIGKCPQIGKLDEFPKFGNTRFYQILRSKGFPLIVGQCITSDRTPQPDGSQDLLVTQIYGGMEIISKGNIKSNDIECLYGSFVFSTDFGALEGNYVDTDYQTYYLAYTCITDKDSRRDTLELYSTDVNFDFHFILPKIYALNFTDSDLEITDHSPEACRTTPVS